MMKRPYYFHLFFCFCFAALIPNLHAQAQKPAKENKEKKGEKKEEDTKKTPGSGNPNIVVNGNFEKGTVVENLYDGVDSKGNLKVPVASSPLYTGEASLGRAAFAPSVRFVDVNNDNLPDLVVSSSLGFLYWYPNHGTLQNPAFDKANLIQTYLGTAARIDVADWNGDRLPDIIFGNIQGLVYVLLNQGKPQEPEWISLMGKPRWVAPLPGPPPQRNYPVQPVFLGSTKYPLSVGNYSAPTFFDWNKDGLPDLIVGEGSYSANSVRLWLNSGTKNNPIFDDKSKFYLSYGDGKEQLTPAIYDWNGDGIPDVLTGDREGNVSLFLGTADSTRLTPITRDPLKETRELTFTRFIKLESAADTGKGAKKSNPSKKGVSRSNMINVCPCDYNHDGIPDIVYAGPDGIIRVALGSGSREDPQLTQGVAIRGKDTEKDFRQPEGWKNTYLDDALAGHPYTGTAPIGELVDKQNTDKTGVYEGNYSFRLSWFEKFTGWFYLGDNGNAMKEYRWSAIPANPPNAFSEGGYILQGSTSTFTLGQYFNFSFWYRGDMTITYNIAYNEIIRTDILPGGAEDKSKKTAPEQKEIKHNYDDTVRGTPKWTKYQKVIRLEGTKLADINTNGTESRKASVSMHFFGNGEGWIDDVQLVEQ